MTVDDHPLLRQGIAALIKSQPGMEIVELSTELRYCLRELGLPREI